LSVLTKIFVGLLIVVVLIQTSGTIVFVNRSEEFKKNLDTARSETARERAARLGAEQEVVAVRGERDLRVMEATARGESLRPALEAALASGKAANEAVAKANADVAKADADKNAALAQAAAALGTIDTQQKTINETATKFADEQKRAAAAETRIAALIKEVDGMKVANRGLKEQITGLENKLDEMAKTRTVINTGGNGADQNAAPGMAAAANLRGVIKDTRMINQQLYGTISLGSAQNVQKGMQFKVIDNGNFLGYLTVDMVDTDEATGHMSGPSLNQVHKGTQVRTQW